LHDSLRYSVQPPQSEPPQGQEGQRPPQSHGEGQPPLQPPPQPFAHLPFPLQASPQFTWAPHEHGPPQAAHQPPQVSLQQSYFMPAYGLLHRGPLQFCRPQLQPAQAHPAASSAARRQ
jgi:hypothetical protein